MVQTEQAVVVHTAQIAAAFVANNTLEADQVPRMVTSVLKALREVAGEPAPPLPTSAPSALARTSLFEGYIVCMDCGRKMTVLKRHISSAHGLTPKEYRLKWGLPAHYPMVPPGYAKIRSQLAKDMGLGKSREARKTRRGR